MTGIEAGVSIYVEDWRFDSNGTKLVISMWEDGYVVWSENLILGGPPYRCGKINKVVFSKLLTEVENDGYFGDPTLEQANFGPDTQFKTLLIGTNNHRLSMQSLHELQTPSRLLPNESRKFLNTKLGMLSESGAADLYYRLAWAELQLKCLRLLPNSSSPVSGSLVMRDGRLWWQPK